MTLPELQRVTRSTFFSRLDFRTKLMTFATVSIVAALWDNPILGGLLMLAILGACLGVGVSLTYLGFMFRVMTPFFLLLILTHGLFNVEYVLRLTGRLHLTPVLTIPTSWPLLGGRSISREGLLYGVNVIFKSMTFLLLIPLCVFTTDPNHLVVGLARLRVPYKLAFVVSATLRFFPLIFGEIQAVMESQRLRGFALEDMGPVERVRVYAKTSVPVILSALFKAQQIEVVMRAKAFSGDPDRTYLEDTAMRAPDWVFASLLTVAFGAALWAYFAVGFGRFVG
jgi:energy-coupling factor transport system permease protein